MGEYVCYFDGLARCAFGKVVFEREDVLMVDKITPNTCYTSEKVWPVLIKSENVIARGGRYDMQSAANAGNVLWSYPTEEKVRAAALKAVNKQEK